MTMTARFGRFGMTVVMVMMMVMVMMSAAFRRQMQTGIVIGFGLMLFRHGFFSGSS